VGAGRLTFVWSLPIQGCWRQSSYTCTPDKRSATETTHLARTPATVKGGLAALYPRGRWPGGPGWLRQSTTKRAATAASTRPPSSVEA